MMFQFILIFAGSLFLVFISRRSLKSIQVHGFYRFFAFELILISIVLNLPVWFKNPLAGYQIVSWVLLVASLYPAGAGFYLLSKARHPETIRQDSTNFSFENTSQLVRSGPYRYIRHPMYASLLYLAWGTALKRVSWVSLLFAFASTLFLYLTARVEEKENIRFFGEAYKKYMDESRMLIPFIW